MPYADPEKRREAGRQYTRDYARRNPEKERERMARYREANREKIRERYRANREQILAQQREYYAANREQILVRNRVYSKKRYAENRQEVLKSNRKFRAANRQKILAANMTARHGPNAAMDWAEMWAAQDGLCYLCGEAMNPARVEGRRSPRATAAVIDHDHRHCPADTSCTLCRRGLACNRCNSLIGSVKDDPAALRLIAANLEAALASVAARLAESQCEQLTLYEVEAIPAPARLRAVSGDRELPAA